MGFCMPCIVGYMRKTTNCRAATIFFDACAYAQTYNALPQQTDMKQQGCKVILEGSEEVVTRKVWDESW